jgi:serine/threonine protein kinase
MAPEVIRQSGHNRFADIWSLGCTVYELFMRKPPWSEYKDISVLFKIEKARGPPPLPKDISSEFRSFIHACFKRNPNARANVYELLRHPFITSVPLVKVQRYNLNIEKSLNNNLDNIAEEETPVLTPY